MAPRILIFGTGSVGTVYAYIFSKVVPASNITAICRSNFDQASQDGFTVHSTVWGNELRVKPVIAKTVEDAVQGSAGQPFDYVVVCAKALPSTPSMAELIAPAVTDQTAVVLIQNGIGIEAPYAERFPRNPLLSTVVYLPATQVRPGTVEHKEVELMHVGTYPADAGGAAKAAARAFAGLLGAGGATARVHEDVQAERWQKLLVNAAWNPVCALSRSRDRGFLDAHADAPAFVRDVMLEVAAVAQACGYAHVNADMVDTQIGRAAVRRPPGVQPSMLADALAGKNIEVDAIVGNVVRLAQQKQVAVPMLRTIYLLACGLDSSFTRARSS